MQFSDLNSLVIESSPMPILLWDSSGRVFDWNRSFEKLIGYTKEEVKQIDEISTLVDTEKERAILDFHKSQKHKTYPKNFLNKQGRMIPTKVMTYPIYDYGLLVAFCSYVKEEKSSKPKLATDSISVLKKQNEILLKLAKNDAIDSGDIQRALGEITEAAAVALNCERSSVWVYTNDETAIEALDLFRSTENDHTSGTILYSKDFPAYFKYLTEERSLAANDAITDPNTFEFAESYLKPLGITSMLDAPFRLSGKMMGVICNEHVGEKRVWTQEEQNFSGSLADLISRAFESFERKKAQDELKEANLALERRVEERTFELREKMEEVIKLKEQQDGDYYLTSLIQNPLCINLNKSKLVRTDFYLEQKKKFQFRKYSAEIGGDICIAGNLRFNSGTGRHVMFMNADAMGKSMQGAGGAIVIGTAMNNIMNLSAKNDRVLTNSPEEWITQTILELNNMFLAFGGSMLVSLFIGLLDEISGELLFANAEHPYSVLYRDAKASFLESNLNMRKLGTEEIPVVKVMKTQLSSGDIILVGSDGRDDLELKGDNGERFINEDENLFLRIVEESEGNLLRIARIIKEKGNIIDDLSLISVKFKES
ncbi:MAG: SpoIIE family protein phosphatase [Leptospiraceae bacterium]|nr:SpoIIE family protein phosphatase [Leptospiraceae bacterium]